MSFLKKKGRQVWVPEVKGQKYVPGYWYTYDEYVHKYVSGGSSGPTAPVVKDNGTIFVPGGGYGGSGPPLIVDY